MTGYSNNCSQITNLTYSFTVFAISHQIPAYCLTFFPDRISKASLFTLTDEIVFCVLLPSKCLHSCIQEHRILRILWSCVCPSRFHSGRYLANKTWLWGLYASLLTWQSKLDVWSDGKHIDKRNQQTTKLIYYTECICFNFFRSYTHNRE